jgi:hypothetical protein
MHCPVVDRLVDEDVAVADLDAEPTFEVGADPGLIVNGGPLAAEIR